MKLQNYKIYYYVTEEYNPIHTFTYMFKNCKSIKQVYHF